MRRRGFFHTLIGAVVASRVIPRTAEPESTALSTPVPIESKTVLFPRFTSRVILGEDVKCGQILTAGHGGCMHVCKGMSASRQWDHIPIATALESGKKGERITVLFRM